MNKIISQILLVILIYSCDSESGNTNGTDTTSGSATTHTSNNANATSGQTNPQQKPKTPSELRAELKASEEQAPLDYLKLKHRMSGNLVGNNQDGWILSGTVTNNATLATFKDVEIQVSYTMNSGTVQPGERFVIYEAIEPGRALQIDRKVKGPSGDKIKSTYVELLNAIPKID